MKIDGTTPDRTLEQYASFLHTELMAAHAELYGHVDLRFFVLPDPAIIDAIELSTLTERAMAVLSAISAWSHNVVPMRTEAADLAKV
jgi:hypothetical protein